MTGVVGKALTALFTNPETHELMTKAQAQKLGVGIALAVGGLFLTVAFALGIAA